MIKGLRIWFYETEIEIEIEDKAFLCDERRRQFANNSIHKWKKFMVKFDWK